LKRGDRLAARASRIMCLSVAFVSLGTALLGIATRMSRPFGAWVGAHETGFGMLVIAVMLVGFLLGVLAAPSKAGAGGEMSSLETIGR
jgi:hypothetical protein